MKQIVIGLGSGRCGTKSLATLLNLQAGIHVSHEGIPALPWQRSLGRLFWALAEVVNRTPNTVGDVGFYWLNYVEWVLKHIQSNARFICLKRDRESTVDSFLRMTAAHNRNHWTEDRFTAGYTVDPEADRAFPKFKANKKDALGLYWDEYYRIADEHAETWPDNFRIYPMKRLNDAQGVKEILQFAGVTCDWNLETVHTNTFKRLAIVVGIRVNPEQKWREENAIHCLKALADQIVPRDRYEIILVEEDTEPRVSAALKQLADTYKFIPSDTAYNRSRVFNVGATTAKLRPDDILCLMDADLLVDGSFIHRCISHMGGSAQAVLPYRYVRYMEGLDTDQAKQDRAKGRALNSDDYQGKTAASQGGTFWVLAGLYKKLGGHDERFVGWGCEDSDFWFRLRKECQIQHANGMILHMWHPDAERGEFHAKNRALYESLHPDRVGKAREVEPASAEVAA